MAGEVWTWANLIGGALALAWGLCYPRRVLPAWRLVWSCALWAVVVMALPIYALAQNILLDRIPGWMQPALGIAMGQYVLALCCLLFPCFCAGGLAGAAMGAVAEHSSPRCRIGPAGGATAWWLASLLLALLALTLGGLGLGRAVVVATLASIPLGCAGILALQLRTGLDPEQVVRACLGGLGRRLVWQWRGKDHLRRLDARGAALGLASGLVVLAAARVGMLRPLQMGAYGWLVQSRGKAMHVAPSVFGPPPSAWDQVVLLEMDTPARRAALSTGSEVLTQAEVLGRLAACGALRIVLPLPLVDETWTGGSQPPADAPLPGPADVARTLAHVPRLASAMSDAGNVILAAPALPDIDWRAPRARDEGSARATKARSAMAALAAAAREVGEPELRSFGTPLLPAIPLQWQQRPPVPLLLLGAIQGRAPDIVLQGSHALVAGKRVGQIDPGRVLVDFQDAVAGRRFARISYTSILRGEPLWDAGARVEGQGGPRIGAWVRPRQYLRGKIVFLDSVLRPARETLAGPMARTEVLAHATATLASGRAPAAPGTVAVVVLTLGIGALAGAVCAHRAPLDATWRAGLVGAACGVHAVCVFLFAGTWRDPAVPLVAAGLAYLLVTQFAFSSERTARARNRSLLERFVSPAVVEELLDDPDGKLGLRGTRQRVCVLFADVRGFTSFAERHSPEDVVEAVNAYMTALTEALHAHRGLLDKYTGDGLMALFRVVDDADDPLGAVRAALAMSAAAAGVSVGRAAQERPVLAIGIGVHIGEAVLGLVGSPVQFNYTALGHAVVVSARLQALAAGGEVLISEELYECVGGVLDAEQRAPVWAKGLSHPIRPYRVIGLAGVVSSPQGRP